MSNGSRVNLPTTVGDLFYSEDDGTYKWMGLKLAFGPLGTQTLVSSSDPLPVTGTITLGNSANDLGKEFGTAAGGNDRGVVMMGRRVDSPATIGNDGGFCWPTFNSTGAQYVTGTVSISNGVTGLQDNTASNFTLGTTQGIATMYYVDDASTASATENTEIGRAHV